MLDSAASAFDPAPGRIYLDAATYGLPPRDTVRAMRRALLQWQRGTGRWIEDWDTTAEACRASFATLIGASVHEIAAQPAVSVAVAIIAASLRPGDEVVVPGDEFTSVLYPFLVAEQRGVRVRQVALEGLPEAIHAGTTLVATSLVQMQTGRAAPLAAVVEAAGRHGTRILIDATQAVPLFPALPAMLPDIDYLVCSGYKHLLCPRGVSFLYVRETAWDTIEAIDANWRAADLPYGRYFGGPLRLAPDAARFDVSLAWFSWVGAGESLRLLAGWQAAGVLDAVRSLAARLSEGLGVPYPGTTLVCVPVVDDAGLTRMLTSAGIRASVRGTSLRLSPHVYNTAADIDRAIEVVAPFVAGRS
jgi:selenocysteine lyase/cysteine desulfurase